MRLMDSLKKIGSRFKDKPDKLFFGKSDKKWNWEDFESTKDFPVSPNLIDWVIGQDKAIAECQLCIDEWMGKLSWLIKKKWWQSFENPMGDKPQPKEMLPAGPFLFMAGDAGTGKSLIGRALANYMTELYLKHGISLHDVLSWRNPIVPSEPKISIHTAGQGKQIIASTLKKKRPRWIRRNIFKIVIGALIGTGLVLTGFTFYSIWRWLRIGSDVTSAVLGHGPLLFGGIGLIGIGAMVYVFSRVASGTMNQNGYSIGGAESKESPKLLVNNSSGRAPFIDATGHTSAQLFGDITWDPYQSGGLGTPEHQRANAGDVHRAHLGILFIDEIKNLIGPEAVTLLSVLEDGQMPITHRGHHGETGAMMVATEPVPAMCFLVAAGNLDSLSQIHPALLDRIQGYGKVVYMNNEMPATPENKQKYVQFIAQEAKRFNLLPFSRSACIAIIEEAMRKSGRNDQLTCKFRPMIGMIKTASVLAKNEGCTLVETKHVVEALEEHCKSIGLQIMEKFVERSKIYRHINPEANPKTGLIHGLAVRSINTESTDYVGSVLAIRASCIPKPDKKTLGYFHVTGVATKDESYVQQSISKVEHVINQQFRIDLCHDFMTHIDFAQDHGVEGPSAGISMTLALISCLTKRKIYQDVAVTGEINIGCGGPNEDTIIITPIGGAHEKIMAAQNMGFKKVCIPIRNFEKNIIQENYKIKVIGCATLEDYIRECLEPKKKP